jgi:flagellar basal body rod protein FlgB
MNPQCGSASPARRRGTPNSTIANNLANVNTVGFKRDRVVFADLAYRVEQQPAQRADGQRRPHRRAARQWHASWGPEDFNNGGVRR